jgi:hypothetical protein
MHRRNGSSVSAISRHSIAIRFINHLHEGMHMLKAYIGVDGVAYRLLIQPKAILIKRAEGPSALCGIEQRGSTWTDAHGILFGNSRTAPKGGAYDKHDFWVTFADGFEYSGRYDLRHTSEDPLDLAAHIRSSLEYMAGRWVCSWAGRRADQIAAIERNYQRWVEENAELVASAKSALETYEVRQRPVQILDSEPFEVVRDYRTHPVTKTTKIEADA